MVGVVAAALLWGGGQGVYTALTNRAPTVMTCAEYLAKRPEATWLRLEQCVPDFEAGGYEGGDKAVRLFLPLRAPGAGADAADRKTRIVLDSKDDALLARVNAGDLAVGAGTYEGLVKFGIELRDKERKRVAEVVDDVHEDFVLLDHGERPKLGLFLGVFLAGLGLAGFVVWRVLRHFRG